MNLRKEDFYRCFSGKQKIFLVKIKGIDNILKANDIKSGNTFWLFYKDEGLSEALREWRMNNPNRK